MYTTFLHIYIYILFYMFPCNRNEKLMHNIKFYVQTYFLVCVCVCVCVCVVGEVIFQLGKYNRYAPFFCSQRVLEVCVPSFDQERMLGGGGGGGAEVTCNSSAFLLHVHFVLSPSLC
jgi:hypothetical protein